MLLLGFGLYIGTTVWQSIAGPFATQTCVGISPWYDFIFLPIVSIGFNVYVGASPRQWPIMTLVASVGFVISYFLQTTTSSYIGAAVAAFAVGIVGNIYGRLTKHVAIAPVISGVMLLVPGGLGVKSATSALISTTDSATISSSTPQWSFVLEIILIGVYLEPFIMSCIALLISFLISTVNINGAVPLGFFGIFHGAQANCLFNLLERSYFNINTVRSLIIRHVLFIPIYNIKQLIKHLNC